MIRAIFLAFILCFSLDGTTQELKDSTLLAPVTITANRLIPNLLSRHYDYLNTNELQLVSTSNVGEALRQQSSVYIKSYGAGSIATTSIQGGGAGHTLVLWNGFPLNTSYLGQTDFSLLPSFFFDEIAVQYGGNAALYGNAAIGGVVHLNSHFSKTSNLQFQSSIGSFGKNTNAIVYKRQHQKWSNAIRWIHQTAANDFPYRIADNVPAKKLSHANTRQTGIMLENKMQYSNKQSLSWDIWWQRLERAIPPTTTQRVSVATQLDEFVRTTLNWRHTTDRQLWQARTALFTERIDYQDSLAGVDALSTGWTSISELEHQIVFTPAWKLYTGLNFTHLRAKTQGYAEGVAQERVAFYTSIQQRQAPWDFALHLRQEWVDGKFVPFLPSVHLGYQIHRKLYASVAATKNYKLPTFNDLYWQPGGNPQLLPESGWSQALDGQYFPVQQLELKFSVFNRVLKNRILWQPQIGSFAWSPSNIDQVWSRGFAVRMSWSQKWQTLQWQLRGGYDFVRSTATQTKDNFALDKQLIYTPQHQGFAMFQLIGENWRFTYSHQYTGTVLIQYRNPTSLAGFQVSNVVVARNWKVEATNITIQGHINNIWNKNYRIIDRRPMPGRNFEVSIFFKQ